MAAADPGAQDPHTRDFFFFILNFFLAPPMSVSRLQRAIPMVCLWLLLISVGDLDSHSDAQMSTGCSGEIWTRKKKSLFSSFTFPLHAHHFRNQVHTAQFERKKK